MDEDQYEQEWQGVFHWICPLDRFSPRVAMSVCLYVCLFVCLRHQMHFFFNGLLLSASLSGNGGVELDNLVTWKIGNLETRKFKNLESQQLVFNRFGLFLSIFNIFWYFLTVFNTFQPLSTGLTACGRFQPFSTDFNQFPFF